MAVVTHVFYKDEPKGYHEILKQAFSGLKNVEEVKPDFAESPIYTLKRILGNEFYFMKDNNSEDDVISINSETEGNFDIDSLCLTVQSPAVILNFIGTVFNSFLSLNGEVFPIEAAKIPELKAKLAVTVEKGVVTEVVTLNDFKKLWNYNEKGDIIGLANQEQISKYADEMNKNNETLQKLGNVNGSELVFQKLSRDNSEISKKILDIYRGIVTDFFDVIKKISNIEDTMDIIDISFILSRELIDQTKRVENMKETDVIMYHSNRLQKIFNIKSKFGLI